MFAPGKRCEPLDEDSLRSCTGESSFRPFRLFTFRSKHEIFLTDETHLEDLYSEGLQVARTHRMIADIVMNSTFAGSFERWWKTIGIERRRMAIYFAVDNSMRPNMGFTTRLL